MSFYILQRANVTGSPIYTLMYCGRQEFLVSLILYLCGEIEMQVMRNMSPLIPQEELVAMWLPYIKEDWHELLRFLGLRLKITIHTQMTYSPISVNIRSCYPT